MPHVSCPVCSLGTYVSPDAVNRFVRCPKCATMFLVTPAHGLRRRWRLALWVAAVLAITAVTVWLVVRAAGADPGRPRAIAPGGASRRPLAFDPRAGTGYH
jgi:hypothetical protein